MCESLILMQFIYSGNFDEYQAVTGLKVNSKPLGLLIRVDFSEPDSTLWGKKTGSGSYHIKFNKIDALTLYYHFGQGISNFDVQTGSGSNQNLKTGSGFVQNILI